MVTDEARRRKLLVEEGIAQIDVLGALIKA
jgi:hypothetical protein